MLHLPIPDYPFEAHYMYFSIAHWRPIVNGYSGYEPATYLEVKRRVQDELYDASTLDYLRELGVTHVAVHPFLFKMPRERKRLLRWERTVGVGPNPRICARCSSTAGTVSGSCCRRQRRPRPSAAPET